MHLEIFYLMQPEILIYTSGGWLYFGFIIEDRKVALSFLGIHTLVTIHMRGRY